MTQEKTAPTADELEFAKLRDAATAFDRQNNGDVPTGDHDPAQKEQAKVADAPKAEADKQLAPEGEQAKPEATAKADKDKARRDKTWREINEEKDRLKAERDAIEAERKQVEQLRSRSRTTEDQEADELDRIARDYEKEDKEDLAKVARERAVNLRRAGQEKQFQSQREQFSKEWKANFDKAAETDPDLHDSESALYKGVEALIKKERILQSVPDGVTKAVEIVKNIRGAARASDLDKQLTEAKAKIDELNKKLALGGSFPQDPAAEKSFDDMSTEDQGKFLKAQAARVDRESYRA